MRIVSLAPSNTEILYAMGAEKEIVGVTRFCDYPDGARDKVRVGGWLDLDYRKIQELKPDLAITSSFVQEKVVERLAELGIEILHVDPVALEEVYESILDIGRVVEKEENAYGLVGSMRERVGEISKKSRDLGYGPRVYAEEWHEPPTVCGNWIPELIELAGGVSLGKKGMHSYGIRTSEVVEFDPDFMVVSWCGFGKNVNVEWIRKRKGWEEINAVKNGKIYVFDDSLLNRPGPRLVEGLELLVDIGKRLG
ncbi:cobalamin-binding protein [Candidatus Micrarchaeota archaeon]|nr:cobalamin-binding protein [Candidatus Micrarchaeota archaeon]